MPKHSISSNNGRTQKQSSSVTDDKVRKDANNYLLFSCPAQGVIDLLSKKWALLIVAVLGTRPSMRYNGLLDEIKGISPKTLADTLKHLEEFRVIKREAFSEIPPRVEYSLTEDGLKLEGAVIPLLTWAKERSKEKDCVILRAVSALYY